MIILHTSIGALQKVLENEGVCALVIQELLLACFQPKMIFKYLNNSRLELLRICVSENNHRIWFYFTPKTNESSRAEK